ncbi:MAG: polysaccharide biosynthesis/export family protein [Candidatus Omnitrophota bacterium]
MKMFKLLLVISAIAVLGVGGVVASELEVVEQDQPLVTAEQPTIALPEVSTPVPEVTPEVKIEEKTEGAVLERATDEKFPEPRGKKSTKPPLPVASKTVDEPTRYTLGPDDVIEIIVRRHSEFSGQYPVNSEGKIQYKFVGDIEIKGLTKTEVKDRVAGILSKFIINPEVDVTIMEYRSKVIYVIGEVGAPGKYYMKADQVSLREAVIQAGLPTLSASMRRTQHIRPSKDGKPMENRVDLYALLYEGKLNLDTEMIAGDIVFVPATFFAKVMRVISPVAAPVGSADTIRRVGTGGF